jgi:hydrogenase maturation protease
VSKPRILIAGIGNIFLGDDGFGSEVARQLMRREWPAAVRVEDVGIRGFDLAFALLDAPELTILIDAVPRGSQPGTLYKIEPELDEMDQGMTIETHGMNPMKVLAMVKSMGGKLNRIFLIACEPQTLGGEEGQMGLSPPVQLAISEAVRMIEELVATELASKAAAAVVSN